jgi:Transposase.
MAVHYIPKKFKSVPSARKIMATNIFDETGVILAAFLPRRATVKLDCYPETLRHLNVHLHPIFPARKVS